MKRAILLAATIIAFAGTTAFAQSTSGSRDYGTMYPQGSGSAPKDYGTQYPQGSGSSPKDYGTMYPQGSGSQAAKQAQKERNANHTNQTKQQ